MNNKPSTTVKGRSVSIGGKQRPSDRLPAYIKLVTDFQRPPCDPLDFPCAEVRDDRTPLTDGSGANPERPGDIRGSLKVIENVLFEHEPSLTVVHTKAQPRLFGARLTSVHMDDLATPAARIQAAMKKAGCKGIAALADTCGVSYQAARKWVEGHTVISHDKAKKLEPKTGWRAEWIRTGKGPRELANASEHMAVEAMATAAEAARAPLTALLEAINAFAALRTSEQRKQQ